MSFWENNKSIDDKVNNIKVKGVKLDPKKCANYIPPNKKDNKFDYQFFRERRGCDKCDQYGNRTNRDNECPLYFPNKKSKN